MPTYKGSCHCGAVRFSIESDISELTICDCSICTRKNAVMAKVHEDRFQLLSDKSNLAEYNWNTKVARHFFCKTCGIYTFHKKRSQPDHYGINVFCLDDFDPSTIPIKTTEGLSMSVKENSARGEWSGPREK